jgi:hypothetical protein
MYYFIQGRRSAPYYNLQLEARLYIAMKRLTQIMTPNGLLEILEFDYSYGAQMIGRKNI